MYCVAFTLCVLSRNHNHCVAVCFCKVHPVLLPTNYASWKHNRTCVWARGHPERDLNFVTRDITDAVSSDEKISLLPGQTLCVLGVSAAMLPEIQVGWVFNVFDGAAVGGIVLIEQKGCWCHTAPLWWHVTHSLGLCAGLKQVIRGKEIVVQILV